MEIKAFKIISRQKLNEYKNTLLATYGKRCGYCKCELGITSPIQLDNYKPVRYYPELEDSIENKVLCCTQCNIIKRDINPIGDNGEIFILYPYNSRYDLEIKCEVDGTLIGITEEARSTIHLLHLNRKELIEYRKNNVADFIKEVLDNKNIPYESFKNEIQNIRKLLSIQIEDKVSREYFYRLLYANIITTMETYLAKVFASQVIRNDDNKWRFVEKNKDWEKDKISYNNLKSAYEGIDIKVQNAVTELLYHNLPKIRALYKQILDIDLFNNEDNMKFLCEAVDIRHDIVHRNGRKGHIYDKEDEFHNITNESIDKLINILFQVIDNIEESLRLS